MAYDDELGDRIREQLGDEEAVDEKRMFGGLAFMVHGHLAVAASGRGGAMVRIDPADADELTAREGVERMVMGGRSMDGWLRVDAHQVADDVALAEWVQRGVAFVRTL